MYDFPDYATMRQKIGELFGQQKFEDAGAILKWALKEFPDHLGANVFNLAFMQVQINQPEKAIETLQYGLDHDVWFGPFELGIDVWAPVKEMDAFKQIQARCEEFREQAQKLAKPELVVVPPKDYDPSQKYPLFIALHGGGETVETFKPQWSSPKLESEFIVAYPQSSRVISMNGFSWTGEPPDRQEIVDVYQAVCDEYNVDSDQILMGGFSAGGHLTLTLLLDEKQVVPMRGFIVLCPPVPEGYTSEAIARIAERGQRGVLLTTEMDNRVEDQRELAAAFQEGRVPLQFEVTSNIGHWYPPDLAEKIDDGIEFILS